MRKLLGVLTLALLSHGSLAAETELPTGYTQVFGCNLKEGKTLENVWGVVERFRTHVSGMKTVAADPNFAAFLWTPFRGAMPYDFVWGVTSSTLPDLGDALTEYYGSQAGTDLDRQFFDVSDCISGIMAAEQLNVGQIGNSPDRQPDGIVDAYQCNLNSGSDMADADNALKAWTAGLAKIDSAAVQAYQAWKWTPFLGGTGQADFMMVGASPDFKTYMQGYADYLASREGQAADRRLRSVSTCLNSIWTGYWVIVPGSEK